MVCEMRQSAEPTQRSAGESTNGDNTTSAVLTALLRPAQQKQGPRQSEIPVPESKSDRTARRCMQSDRYLQMKVSQKRDLSIKSAF